MTLNDARLVKQVAFGEWSGSDKARACVRRYLLEKGYAVESPGFHVTVEAADHAAALLHQFGQQQEGQG